MEGPSVSSRAWTASVWIVRAEDGQRRPRARRPGPATATQAPSELLARALAPVTWASAIADRTESWLTRRSERPRYAAPHLTRTPTPAFILGLR